MNKLVESRFIGTVLAKPKAKLCEPWEPCPFEIRGAREAGDISFSLSGYSWPLRGSRKFYSLVTQGSQSLALGLTTTAASQLVEATSGRERAIKRALSVS